MNRKEVMKMFNRKTRIGSLATSNKNGDVNAAVFSVNLRSRFLRIS